MQLKDNAIISDLKSRLPAQLSRHMKAIK